MITREQQLLSCIPDVLNYKTLLYVGAKAVEKPGKGYSGMRMIPVFKSAGYQIDVIEINPSNIDLLRKFNKIQPTFRIIMEGDVRLADQLLDGHDYDVVMWYHGPEHLEEKEIVPTLRKLERFAKKLLIVACPWGFYKQGSIGGNQNEIHRTSIYPGFFKSLGWKENAIGQENIRGSNLLSWQYIIKMRETPFLSDELLNFMENILNKQSRVLEFGSGTSTLWFAERAHQVISYENKILWYEAVNKKLQTLGVQNVDLRLDQQYPATGALKLNGGFDLILVDGRGRVISTETSYAHLNEGGWLVLDNSQRPRYTAIHQLMAKIGWKRREIQGYMRPKNKPVQATAWQRNTVRENVI